MREQIHFYEIKIDDKKLYFYTDKENNNTSVLFEYFTNTQAFFKVIGKEIHDIYNDDGEISESVKNVYGLIFPREKLIYASSDINKNYVKDYFDKNQPSVTRQFKFKNLNMNEFYHAIKFKLQFSKINKNLVNMFLKEQVYIKNRDIKKDLLEEEKEKLLSIKKETENEKVFKKLFPNKTKKY